MLQNVNGKLMLSDNFYAFGKKLVQIYIPALGALYFGLANIWGLPDPEKVVGSLAVIATFIGICLGISSKNFDASGAAHDGDLVIETSDTGHKVFSLQLNGDPDTIADKGSISFKVKPKK